ncbi:MAG: tetratricopeptide repeat protein [Candidatus Eremiobacterota bacterium]
MKSLFITILLLIIITGCFCDGICQEKMGDYLTEARKFQGEGKIDSAIDILNKAIEKDPSFKEAYYMLGNIYITESYYRKASEVFKKLNELLPDDLMIQYLMAVSDFLSYDYISASKKLEKILNYNPRDTISRGYLVLTLSRMGQNDRALDELMTVVKYNLKGDSDYTLYTKIESYAFNTDLVIPSLKDLKEIVENNTKNPMANVILGWFDYNENATAKAAEHLKKAAEENPSDAVAHYIFGLISYSLNDPETAVIEYEKAYKLDRKLTESVQEKFQYIEQAKRDKHILDLERKLTEEPENDRVIFELAKIYYYRYSYSQAQTLLEKAIKVNPKEIEYYNLLGTVYIKKYEWQKAIDIFKKTTGMDRKNGSSWSNLCYACERAGYYKEAIEAGEESLVYGKGDIQTWSSMAISYYYLEEFDKSIESFQKAINMDQNNGELFCRYAMALQWKGKIDEAAKNYKKAIELEPDLLDSYYNLGNTLMTAGNYEDAIKYFQQVLSMRSKYRSIYTINFNESTVNIAQAMMELNDYEKAIEKLDIVISSDPLNIRAHLFKAYAYDMLNKKEEAKKEFIKTFSLMSSIPFESSEKGFTPYSLETVFSPIDEPFIHYGVSMEDQWLSTYLGEPQFVLSPERKEVEIIEDIKKHPDRTDLALELIKLYLYERRAEDALKKLSTVDEKKIDSFQLHNIKGIIYTLQGKTDIALIEFNRALELNSQSFEIHNNIAVVYQFLKNYGPAIDHLKKSIELNFINSWAYNNLGMIYIEQKNYTNAEEVLYFAKVSDLKSPWIRHNLGWTYYKLNKSQEAIKELKEAIKLKPGEVTFPEHLGWIYYEHDDNGNALKSYYKVLEINPQKDNIYNAIGIILAKEHKYIQAVSNYKKALKINGTEELYHRNLGIAYYKLDKYAEASQEFQKALNINYYSSENQINLSSALFKQGKTEDGMTYLKNALSYNEHDYNPVIDLIISNNQGAIYLEQGKLDLAEHQFQNIINYKDTYKGMEQYITNYYVEVYNNMAILKYRQGLTEEAVNILKNTIKIAPDFSSTLNNLALLEDKEQAVELYEKAIKLDGRGLYYNNLGVMYFKSGNIDKAIEILKKGKTRKLAIVNYNLGGAYLQKNMLNEAMREFKNIPVQSYLSPEACYYTGLIYYREGKKIRAREKYEEAITMKKTSDNLVNAGWLLLNLKAYELAMDKFRDAIRVNAGNVSAYAGMATCYFNISNMDRAMEEANKGIKSDPSSEKPYIIRALVYYHNKDFDRTIEDLKKAIQLNPQNSLVYYNYGYILQEKKDTDRAIKAFEQAISLNKTSILATGAGSFIYFLKGDYEKAKESAYQVIENDITFADAYYILGRVAEKEGNKEKAIFEYKRALKTDPLHVEAGEAVKRLK